MLARFLIEHDHILKTLNLLEMQFLDICRDGSPDFSLMRSILDYIKEYPEQIHHPLEDMVYLTLLERVSEEEAELIQQLMTQHSALEVETRNLMNSLGLLKSGVISMGEIKQQLSHFLITQRQHIYIEESTIHPLVHSILTKDDWTQIQAKVPLFKK